MRSSSLVEADGGEAWTADCTGTTLSSREQLAFRVRTAGHLAAKPFWSFRVPLMQLKLDRAKGTIDR